MRPSSQNKSDTGIGKFFAIAAVFLAGFVSSVPGQSTNQDYPTPVSSNEVNGSIKPRDVGDPRLTTFYYLVETGVGDLFINLLTRNFTGDVDIFTLNGLQPLGKIVVYADFAENETGRVVYLRKPEKLLVRIQGRTPGDEPATFRMKFAGSFVASRSPETEQPDNPKVRELEQGDVRVNSVGTIVPSPKKREAATAERAKTSEPEVESTPAAAEREIKIADQKKADQAVASGEPEAKVGVVVTDATKEVDAPASASAPRETPRKTRPTRTGKAKSNAPKASGEAVKVERPVRTKKAEERNKDEATVPKADPLASIHLVVTFKDGRKIERPMNEVLRFSVDKGQLTVISKDGSVGRYSLFDVAKVTIE